MLQVEILGLGKSFTRDTNNLEKTFTEIADELKKDIYVGGTEVLLREGGLEARISLSPRKIFLFKNNEDTRRFTIDYLTNQLNELKRVTT